jgi:proton-translocating NADH-quinone oxidoreductase chain M
MNWLLSNILLILIVTPLIGTIIILGLPLRSIRENKNRDKEIALITSLITFWLAILVWFYFDNGNPDFQMVQKLNWMPLSGTNFIIGLDGISLFFILLTALLIPICILSSWESVQHLTREFVVCLLVLETLLITVFLVLDLISFYIFFESTLIPMLLIIVVWGSRKEKIQAAYYLFIYTLIGSVLMLLGIFYLYYQIGTTDYQILLNSNINENVQKWLWLAFFASFAVKIPMVPFHIWLPQAHTEAHLSGSIILAGILLKLGN